MHPISGEPKVLPKRENKMTLMATNFPERRRKKMPTGLGQQKMSMYIFFYYAKMAHGTWVWQCPHTGVLIASIYSHDTANICWLGQPPDRTLCLWHHASQTLCSHTSTVAAIQKQSLSVSISRFTPGRSA